MSKFIAANREPSCDSKAGLAAGLSGWIMSRGCTTPRPSIMAQRRLAMFSLNARFEPLVASSAIIARRLNFGTARTPSAGATV